MTRDDFLRELVDSAPKGAEPEQKKAFADAVFSRLGGLYPRAWRVRYAPQLRDRFELRLEALRRALNDLQDAIKADPVGANRIGLSRYTLHKRAKSLKRYAKPILDRLVDQGTKSRKGRNNRGDLAIAAMLAEEYETHFGEPPAHSNADMSVPFAGVCRVVQDFLRETHPGHAINLGRETRRKVSREPVKRTVTESKKN